VTEKPLTTPAAPEDESFGRAWLRIGSSTSLAIVLMVTLAVLTAAGTLVIQNETPQKYYEIYGHGLGGFIVDAGLDDLFHSALYQFAMALLVVNLLLCIAKRPFSRRYIGFHLTHFSLIVILTGGIIGAVWGDKGYVEIREGESITSYDSRLDQQVKPLPFSLTLKSFHVDYKAPEHRLHLMDGARGGGMGAVIGSAVLKEGSPVRFVGVMPGALPDITVRSMKDTRLNEGADAEPRYQSSLTLDIGGAAVEMGLPGRQRTTLGDKELVYAVTPMVGAYRSEITVNTGKADRESWSLIVNNPYYRAGYRLYQANYRKDEEGAYTISGLEVVKDPGLPVAFAGFWTLILGVFWQFYIRQYLDRRKGAQA